MAQAATVLCLLVTKNQEGSKGGFPIMVEITLKLPTNIRRQFFFVITIPASTRCLVENFHLICYSQGVNVN